MNVDQIANSLAQQRPRMTGELLTPLEQHEIERFFRAQVLVNQFLNLSQELSVLQDGELDVKDRGLFRARVLFGPCTDLVQPLLSLFQRSVEALDLTSDGFVGNYAVAHVRNFPSEKVDRPVHDSGRRGHPRESLCHQLSPNLLAITAARASMASSASSPSARRTIVAPHSAASIITPMM